MISIFENKKFVFDKLDSKQKQLKAGDLNKILMYAYSIEIPETRVSSLYIKIVFDNNHFDATLHAYAQYIKNGAIANSIEGNCEFERSLYKLVADKEGVITYSLTSSSDICNMIEFKCEPVEDAIFIISAYQRT